ncbi:MAG: hypothetical protein KF905_03680 [Flavobacteriales bacterium]|nr:hypothetical protein [Flavobacteriales bacterium]
MKLATILSILCWALLSVGCKKEQVRPNVPAIELLSVSPLQVSSFGEGVKVRIRYEDGDGDLGFADPDTYALEVKEARLNAADRYHVPPLAPEGSTVSIQGDLEVELTPLFLLGNGTQEQTTYTIRLRDRAGNWSNRVTTPTITITQ